MAKKILNFGMGIACIFFIKTTKQGENMNTLKKNKDEKSTIKKSHNF